MESMNLFENTGTENVEEKKDNLIHYQGEIGDFWYDPKEFEVHHNYDGELFCALGESDYLHYVGHGLSVSLPEGCINTRGMFYKCKLPEGFTLGDKFDTSKVVNMENMFYQCKLPAGFSLGDKFDTGNVKIMRYMFQDCVMPDDFYLGKNFTICSCNQDTLEDMFDNCRLPMDTDEDDFSEYIDTISWLQQQKYIVLGENVPYQGELGDFSYDPKEFEVCHNYDGIYHEYLHYVGNSNSVSLPKGCISTRRMFWKCELPEGFQLVGFDTSNVTVMAEMFANCTLPDGFALDDKFDTTKVVDMRGMFAACKMSDNFTLGVNFNVSNVTDTDNMFSDCALPEGRSLKDFNKSSYFIISWLKQRKYYLRGKEKVHYEGVLGDFDYDPREFIITHTENYDECLRYHGSGNSISLPKGCIRTRNMFEGCDLPEGFKLANFDTSEVVDMSDMFYGCKLPDSFSLGDDFNTARVKYMGGMFQACELPEGFTLGDKFNTSSVIEMYSMFESCVFQEGFSLGDKFDTSKVLDMAGMFANAKLPEDFTLGEKFTFGTAINLSNMFYCVEFPKVFSLNDFTFTANRDYADMFFGCKFPAGFWLGGFPVKQLGKIICAFTSKIVL